VQKPNLRAFRAFDIFAATTAAVAARDVRNAAYRWLSNRRGRPTSSRSDETLTGRDDETPLAYQIAAARSVP